MDGTTSQRGTSEAMFLGVASSFVAGLFVWWLVSRINSSTVPITKFIDPAAVSAIADQLPRDEDEFLLSAWELVGAGVKYDAFGSIVEFRDSTVECQNCLLPDRMLRMSRPHSNCVGKSALLTSILRTRLPPERVYMVVGAANVSPRPGGHAWVTAKRGSEWYILESTVPPSRDLPWHRAEELSDLYVPEAFVNDYGVFCSTGGDICKQREHVQVKGICPCRH